MSALVNLPCTSIWVCDIIGLCPAIAAWTPPAIPKGVPGSGIVTIIGSLLSASSIPPTIWKDVQQGQARYVESTWSCSPRNLHLLHSSQPEHITPNNYGGSQANQFPCFRTESSRPRICERLSAIVNSYLSQGTSFLSPESSPGLPSSSWVKYQLVFTSAILLEQVLPAVSGQRQGVDTYPERS
ncbi:hypothetical protein CISG_02393 [Coccidioides immitis RMSCC 3703]|uniref:Uncharacterized protein n=2 Tax=Coccidioides immitis TaxID=5501 RepID=A0A0J8U203_COCIT|nr:hypothetical protein CIRG_05934 [Coccidioides immitis RMSCC 2394]KMU80542.1 hypothetical protein CISG_02393 [Coccidioides immitis RMSCC 3703]